MTCSASLPLSRAAELVGQVGLFGYIYIDSLSLKGYIYIYFK